MTYHIPDIDIHKSIKIIKMLSDIDKSVERLRNGELLKEKDVK